MPIQELVGNGLKCEQPPLELLEATPAMGPRKPRSDDDRPRSGGGGNRGRGGRHSSRDNRPRR